MTVPLLSGGPRHSGRSGQVKRPPVSPFPKGDGEGGCTSPPIETVIDPELPDATGCFRGANWCDLVGNLHAISCDRFEMQRKGYLPDMIPNAGLPRLKHGINYE
jgi:hypothetical protein